MLVLAFVIVYVLWHIVSSLVMPLFWFALSLAMLGVFCYAVYAVYKMLTKEKQVW